MDALLFVFQWQRECDGGVLLLQEGGPCGDCHALYGASSYCGKCVLVLVWDETQKILVLQDLRKNVPQQCYLRRAQTQIHTLT